MLLDISKTQSVLLAAVYAMGHEELLETQRQVSWSYLCQEYGFVHKVPGVLFKQLLQRAGHPQSDCQYSEEESL